jgi:hypothetical protein
LYNENQEVFSGRLHGNGKKISGLVLTDGEAAEEAGYAGAAYMGLFGFVYGAYIHDLTIELANTAEQPVSQLYTGVLAGLIRSSHIENITLTAKENAALYVTTNVTGLKAGGAAAQIHYSSLENITSSIPLVASDTSSGAMTIGGIVAVGTDSNTISGSRMIGNITINSESGNIIAGGIVGNGSSSTSLKNCEVEIDEFIVNSNRTMISGTVNKSIGGIGGNGSGINILNCNAVIKTFALDFQDTAANGAYVGIFYVGGLIGEGGAAGKIEKSYARIEEFKLETAKTDAEYNTSFAGGLAGRIGTINQSYMEGIEGGGVVMTVTLPCVTNAVDVGGLAGSGDISKSWVKNLTLKVKRKESTTLCRVGGLTGTGVAKYSFIGMADNPVVINAENIHYVGGVSGAAQVTATKSHQYNYAFCDINLTTLNTNSAVGGLAGNLTVSGSGQLSESYAAGRVIVNNSATSGSPIVNIGGIAGSATTNITISKCAALNGEVTITGNGDATVTKNWGRIASNGTTFTNNITTIKMTIPNGHTVSEDTVDGLFKASVTQADFETDGLDWDFNDIWEWDEESGYPVLKADIFED